MSNLNGQRTKWQRVSRRHRCPICDHPDWCLLAGPVDSPDAVICSRIESAKRVGTRGAGWLHRLRDDPFELQRQSRVVTIGAPSEPATDLSAMARDCHQAMGPHLRGLLADGLSVSIDSLVRLGVGWSARHRATTWPMTDASGVVRGIRLRAADGRKWSVRGGREGLFIPANVPIGDTLVIVEGATDTAALLDMHLDVVGRPSCTGGVSQLVDLIETWHPQDVVIIADADAPGQRGARYLAARLVGYVPDGVRIVTPPAKDAREWVRAGADRLDILDAIEAAPTLTLSYTGRAIV
jgi:5S rRNA maturation endonuclease (ribonuclease M5)